MSLPNTMRAIKCTGPGQASVKNNIPLPDVPDDYILVKPAAVALNPTDWKHIHNVAEPDYDHSVGCDYAGTVVSVGSGVRKAFRPGDRVMGYIHGQKHEDRSSGAFAEYAKAKGDIQIQLPDDVSFEAGAGMPTGINTVGQSLYESMGIPWPNATLLRDGPGRVPLLIYGGSTATGMYAIKYARLSGMYVIATCSERNFDTVKNLGADAVFDYRDSEKCAREIRDLTENKLTYAMDCVSSEESAAICAAALTTDAGAKYRCLLPLKFSRDDVEHDFTLGYSAIGEPYTFFGNYIKPTPENYDFAKKWWSLAEKLIAEKKLTPLEPTLGSGGLEGVLEGLEDLRRGKVSGEKLVYKVP